MPLGLYISVPFCRSKCSYCNFASDVFSRAVFERYVDRVCSDMRSAAETAGRLGSRPGRGANSIYLGGGTPTILDVSQLRRLFVTISQNFDVLPGAEITVECAPGTLSPVMLETLLDCGVNRVSLGVQSFVNREASAVGRLHTGQTALDDIARLRVAGIANVNVDLIAGLPHQTMETWHISLEETINCGVPHVSVYMLEVDEDSRLGRELMAGGTRYHAHFAPNDDLTADLYLAACERLQAAGIKQYEISNFARAEWQSHHNLKYWTRQPYLGFGVDAHSMLPVNGGVEAVRFATADSLEKFVAGEPPTATRVSAAEALEETFFLGLRLNEGVNLLNIRRRFGAEPLAASQEFIQELVNDSLLDRDEETIRLTPRGRLLSNEVFAKFIASPAGIVQG
jgi:oxygen-independent coproporphyrinogen-3 oxidase